MDAIEPAEPLRCQQCGHVMDAKRPGRKRYCGDRCRKAASRSPANADRRAALRELVRAEVEEKLRAELEERVNQIIAENERLTDQLASRGTGHWCPGHRNNAGVCTRCHMRWQGD